MNKSKGVSALVLAAGSSTRMGTLKQLLPFQDSTMIEMVIAKLISSKVQEIVIVLGYQAKKIFRILNGLPIRFVINKNWNRGMLSSVQCGLNSIKEAAGILVCLGDQPFINPDLINLLIDEFEKGQQGMVIPSYKGKKGHPVLISTKYKDEIFNLDSKIGLKQLMRLYPDDIKLVETYTPDVLKDIDVPEDYFKYHKTNET